MRASDADRDNAADALRRHHGAGRIDDLELEERMASVLAARTLEEIAAQFEDLPRRPARADPAPAVPAAIEIGGWGLREFRQRHVLRCSRKVAWRQVMSHVAPSMSAYGYTVVDRHEPDYIVFEITEKPAWTLLVSVFAYLLSEDASRVVIALTEPAPDHTELLVSGRARRPVRKAFAQISGPA